MVGERVGVRAMSLASVCLLTIRAPRRELGEFAERARDDPERGDARAVVVVGEIPVRARKEAACTARRMARAIEGMILDVHGRRDWAGKENGWCGTRRARRWWFKRERVACPNVTADAFLYARSLNLIVPTLRLNIEHVTVLQRK
jgi:hypothetical protein